MDIEEIQKAVLDFESKLKPVTAEEKAMAAGEEPEEELEAVLGEMASAGATPEELEEYKQKYGKAATAPVLPPTPVEVGEACVDKKFKSVVVALYPQYVGKGDVPGLIKEFIDSIPECKE